MSRLTMPMVLNLFLCSKTILTNENICYKIEKLIQHRVVHSYPSDVSLPVSLLH